MQAPEALLSASGSHAAARTESGGEALGGAELLRRRSSAGEVSAWDSPRGADGGVADGVVEAPRAEGYADIPEQPRMRADAQAERPPPILRSKSLARARSRAAAQAARATRAASDAGAPGAALALGSAHA